MAHFPQVVNANTNGGVPACPTGKKAFPKADVERTFVKPDAVTGCRRPIPEDTAATRSAASVAKFNSLVVEALTEGPKRIKELYQLALDRQPQNCPNVLCRHRRKTSKSMEWQHQIRRELAHIATNRDGLWCPKTVISVAGNPPVVTEEEPLIDIEQDVLPPPSVPVSYTGDPYVVTAEGLPEWARTEPHFMDMEELKKAPKDRFVVPNDFEEFYVWKPNFVFRWVKKRLNRFVVHDEVKDTEQELLAHLCCLPQTSMYREAGKKDVVQAFDPILHYGANEARFRNYINGCLANKFSTMHTRRMKDILCRPGNLSVRGQMGDDDPCSVNDEYCHSHSAYMRQAAKAFEKQAHDRARLQEFEDFVRREDSKVLPAMAALRATGTQGDAADWLGTTQHEFGRMLRRLRQLRRCFLSGEPVPKQRRPYKRRIGPPQFSRSGLAARKAQ